MKPVDDIIKDLLLIDSKCGDIIENNNVDCADFDYKAPLTKKESIQLAATLSEKGIQSSLYQDHISVYMNGCTIKIYLK